MGVIGVSLFPVSKPASCIRLLEIACVAPQLCHQVAGGFQDIDGRAAGRDVGGSQRAGKQERPPLLPQMLDDDLLPRHKTSDDAKGLGKRADFHIDASVHMKVIDGAAPAFPKDSFAVRVVHHDHRVVFFRQLHQGRQRRDIAIHGKNAVGDDQRTAGSAG